LDVTGKVVSAISSQEFLAGTNEITLATSSLENGIYFVRVSNGSALSVHKVIVMH
jgi:hypothetical protein